MVRAIHTGHVVKLQEQTRVWRRLGVMYAKEEVVNSSLLGKLALPCLCNKHNNYSYSFPPPSYRLTVTIKFLIQYSHD